jgi:hypothetical protein
MTLEYATFFHGMNKGLFTALKDTPAQAEKLVYVWLRLVQEQQT